MERIGISCLRLGNFVKITDDAVIVVLTEATSDVKTWNRFNVGHEVTYILLYHQQKRECIGLKKQIESFKFSSGWLFK